MATQKNPLSRTSAQLRYTLRSIREGAAITQKTLATHLGFSQGGVISAIEQGLRDTKVPVLEAWVSKCGFRIEIVRNNSALVNVDHLEATDRETIMRLIRAIPQLDPILRTTLAAQAEVWSAVVPEEVGMLRDVSM